MPVKNREPKVSCDRVWGELHAGTQREGRGQYRAYILNWLETEQEERAKPDRKQDKTVFNPFSETKLGCYLGGDEFRDFIQGLLGKERTLDSAVVGSQHWRKETSMAELLGAIAEARGIDSADLFEPRRPHPERDAAMYLCREVGEKTLREIGETFGIKYAAVSLATKRVREHVTASRKFRKAMHKCRNDVINILKP